MTTIEFAPVSSLNELLALQEKVGKTPEGGAAVLIAALLSWAEDDPKAESYLASALASGQLQFGQLKLTDRQRLARQLRGRQGTIHSYIEGATPENGYQLPEAPFKLHFTRNPYSGEESSGRVKVFVACAGASTPRPVTLKRESDGIWRGHEWSSLVVGVAAPR